jgi:UDP-N-acetylglucosamine:LPS N-acetylglucosamine transferase
VGDHNLGAASPGNPPARVCLVGSSGGHLTHLLALEPWWRERDRSWVTFNMPDAVSRLTDERVYWCRHPTNRNVPNLIRNTVLAFRVLRRERPDLVVSSGAAVAVSFAYVARLMRIKFVFIEVVDRVTSATLTGKLVRPVANLIIVQWPEQRRLYAGSQDIGRLL